MGSLVRTMPVETRREQSPAEELANSLSHGLALIAALMGGPYLIAQAGRRADAALVVGTSLFCATIVVLYLASTLYHALPANRAKRVLRVIDHASIFLLIAGSYTPFTLGVLRGAWGWSLFGVVWGLALAGIVLKSVGKASHPIFSTGLYLLMGWLVVVAVDPLFAKVPAAGLVWLLAGGLFYTAGVAFYATDSRLHFGHLIWHLFVMAGTTCHYFAVLWYAA
ncbi:MAG TPA: hemolysin III family protein [Rubrivivax sp.]|nr:hemolysin III family protein [Rubrivivax sp.]